MCNTMEIPKSPSANFSSSFFFLITHTAYNRSISSASEVSIGLTNRKRSIANNNAGDVSLSVVSYLQDRCATRMYISTLMVFHIMCK